MPHPSKPKGASLNYLPVEEFPESSVSDDRIARPMSTRDRIFERLLDDLVSLRLKPGEPVSVKDISAAFAVSRSPVREAVVRLTDAGFMEVIPQSGTRVAPISMQIVRRIYFLRTAIETALVETLAEDNQPRQITTLRDIVRKQSGFAEEGNLKPFYRLDEQFHETISDFAGYARIWATIGSQKAHMDRMRHLVLPQPQRLLSIVAEHGRIIDCIEANDPNGARRAMREHLQQVLQVQKVLQEQHPEYFETAAQPAMRRTRK